METRFEERLHNAMMDNHVFIDGDINWSSSEFQRFRDKNSRKSGKPLFVIVSNAGASFGDFRNPASWQTVWEKSLRDCTPRERAQRLDHIKIMEDEKQSKRNKAIEHAGFLFNHSASVEASMLHPYVKNKAIIPYYARQLRSYLMLPITDVDGHLQSLQYIKSNGWKQFKKHATPKGGMMIMAEYIYPEHIIHLCEGYATGCSIYEAVGSPVVVAFSANNLPEVAVALRLKFPHNHIVLCADNDQYGKENVGLKYAKEAAIACGGAICIPNFDKYDKSKKPTDFNDLFLLAGIEEVERQLSISQFVK